MTWLNSCKISPAGLDILVAKEAIVELSVAALEWVPWVTQNSEPMEYHRRVLEPMDFEEIVNQMQWNKTFET